MAEVSRGRRSLLAVLQRTTALEVAARCGVTQPTVSRWASGEKNPSAAARLRLAAAYGITPAAWDAVAAAVAGRCRAMPR